MWATIVGLYYNEHVIRKSLNVHVIRFQRKITFLCFELPYPTYEFNIEDNFKLTVWRNVWPRKQFMYVTMYIKMYPWTWSVPNYYFPVVFVTVSSSVCSWSSTKNIVEISLFFHCPILVFIPLFIFSVGFSKCNLYICHHHEA